MNWRAIIEAAGGCLVAATRNSASSERSSRSKDCSEQSGIPPYDGVEQLRWAGLPQWLAKLTRRSAPLHLASQTAVLSEKRVRAAGFFIRNTSTSDVLTRSFRMRSLPRAGRTVGHPPRTGRTVLIA